MKLYEKLHKAIKEHSSLEDSEIIEAGEHGADAGYSGFIYANECVEFYEKNEDAIYELLQSVADDIGSKNIDELVSGFQRSDMLASPDGRKNLLAWFTLEEVGRWLSGWPGERTGGDKGDK